MSNIQLDKITNSAMYEQELVGKGKYLSRSPQVEKLHTVKRIAKNEVKDTMIIVAMAFAAALVFVGIMALSGHLAYHSSLDDTILLAIYGISGGAVTLTAFIGGIKMINAKLRERKDKKELRFHFRKWLQSDLLQLQELKQIRYLFNKEQMQQLDTDIKRLQELLSKIDVKDNSFTQSHFDEQ